MEARDFKNFYLVVTGLAIGLLTSRLLNIDLITTILDAVRLLTVLLILPLIVKCLNWFGLIKS